jgi:peptide/nickel transport system substrate-binding protein
VAGAAYDTHLIVRNIYDPLVFLDSGGQFRPALAQSWEVSQDGLSYTFKLRDGVTFHDGTPFDANAVKFTWDTILDPATKALTAKDLLGPNFKSVDVVDPLTARATFSKPYAPFLSAVSQYWLAPVSPTAYKSAGADYGTHQVGTGPFVWSEYVPKDHITLRRNAAYNWAPEGMKHQGAAYLDTVTFKFVSEVGVRTGTLQSGEVQIADDLPPKDVVTLKTDPNMALYQAAVPGLATVLFLNSTQAANSRGKLPSGVRCHLPSWRRRCCPERVFSALI